MMDDITNEQYAILSRESIALVGGSIREKIEASTVSIRHFREVQSAVRDLGCEFVWVKEIYVSTRAKKGNGGGVGGKSSGTSPDGVLFLLRLSAGMVDTFALTSEIPVFVSRHADVQSRLIIQAFNALTVIDDRDFDRSRLYCFVPTNTFAQSMSLSDKAMGDVAVIDGQDCNTIKTRFVQYLIANNRSPNRYDKFDPVVARDFYGRERTLNTLKQGVLNQEVQGVFGMRKTGKTSVLHELKNRYGKRPKRFPTFASNVRSPIFVYFDLESYNFTEAGEIEHMARDLASEITRELAISDQSRKDIASYAETDGGRPLREFLSAVSKTLQYKKNSDLHLVVMLDEIEHLCPQGGMSPDAGAKIVQFLQILRKLVQDSKNAKGDGKFSLVIAGLAPSIVEDSQLHGKDNPLFRFVKSTFLGPLDVVESKSLLVGIGGRMGMKWSDDACSLAYQRTGGNVILLRELGSGIAEERDPYDLSTFPVDGSMVESASRNLAVLAKDYLAQAMSHLEHRYREEFDLISLVVETGERLESAARDLGVDLVRLDQLGLVETDESGHSVPSRLLDLAIAGRSSSQKLNSQKMQFDKEGEARAQIEDCIHRGEGKFVEFKSTFLTPVKRNGEVIVAALKDKGKQDALIHSCFKSFAAFANTSGGTLLIGVGDDGSPIGVDQCIKTLGGKDAFLLKVSEQFGKRSARGDVSHLYDVDIVTYSGVLIAVVQVREGRVFSADENGHGEGIYVRATANSKFLEGLDMLNYLSREGEAHS